MLRITRTPYFPGNTQGIETYYPWTLQEFCTLVIEGRVEEVKRIEKVEVVERYK
ncbi:MAG: hypothetical protein M0Q91_12675 [Methanoregula sp.]|jgi:hypothetical protein|nr:hypothetical protein [Methanoregula sp.]